MWNLLVEVVAKNPLRCDVDVLVDSIYRSTDYIAKMVRLFSITRIRRVIGVLDITERLDINCERRDFSLVTVIIYLTQTYSEYNPPFSNPRGGFRTKIDMKISKVISYYHLHGEIKVGEGGVSQPPLVCEGVPPK